MDLKLVLILVKSLESKISRIKAVSKSPKKIQGAQKTGDYGDSADNENSSDNSSGSDNEEYEMEVEELGEESGSQYETETEVETSESDESIDLGRFVLI